MLLKQIGALQQRSMTMGARLLVQPCGMVAWVFTPRQQARFRRHLPQGTALSTLVFQSFPQTVRHLNIAPLLEEKEWMLRLLSSPIQMEIFMFLEPLVHPISRPLQVHSTALLVVAQTKIWQGVASFQATFSMVQICSS